MCGIAGYLSKRDDPEPVGRIMMGMLTSLARRGPDSVGMALYRTEPAHRAACWIRLPAGGGQEHERRILTNLAVVADVGQVERHEGLIRVELSTTADPATIRAAAEAGSDEVEVVSLGRQLELVKQVGHPEDLARSFGIEEFRGSHAIGHTRLSTESRVDLTHSQPFWARGIADVATVHNGHITNYHKLRRLYEQRGCRFFSENDSEIIGVYLADQLDRGLTLEQALEASLNRLADIENVVAVKEATELDKYIEEAEVLRGRVSILADNNGYTLLAMLLNGAEGTMVGISNVGTHLWIQLWNAVQGGDLKEAVDLTNTRLLPLMNCFIRDLGRAPASFVSRVKEALVMMGHLPCGAVRQPEPAVTDEQRQQIRTALTAAGLLS